MEKKFVQHDAVGLGICLGATNIAMVEVGSSPGGTEVLDVVIREHDGNPKEVLHELLDGYQREGVYVGVTGRKFREVVTIPSITEPEATEIAYHSIKQNGDDYDAIVSAGGETFIVYEIDKRDRIARVSSGNKCASGTGEFFLQQLRRMDTPIEEAMTISKSSTDPHELSGRCSVFCKSDCTHALNKGEKIADVAAGLSRMIAKKIEELLVRIGARRVLVVGGTSQNDVVIETVRESFERVSVPEHGHYFEAYGAALWAIGNKQSFFPGEEELFQEVETSFHFLDPLSEHLNKVVFKEMPYETPSAGDRCIVGLDVGSTTTKAVLLRTRDRTILKSVYLRTNGAPIKAARECYRSLADQLEGTPVEVVALGVTGSGRYITGLHANTPSIINEIIAHARAAAHFDSEVDTIFEIGGQDAKYTYLTNGVASDYAMNEACSAGTGSFLEESAYESLGVEMEEIAEIALKARRPPNFSDQCAAFISSDIKSAFQEGIGRDDIVAGLVYSICINYINRVKGSRQTGGKVFMQGGVCYNRAVPVAMAALTGKEIIVPPDPGLMGAYGVALEVENMLQIGLLEEGRYALDDLAGREVGYGKPFICRGGQENCDRKCSISIIEVEGRKIPFGGACNKYYNKLKNIEVDTRRLNHVVTRRRLLFEDFVEPRGDLPSDAPVVGINKSFQTHTLYPLYFNFFDALGCRVVLSQRVDEDAIKKGMTCFCLSGQIALGLFGDLLDQKPDYVFMPQIMEMQVSPQKEYRKEYQTVCMFVQGEPFYQRATFMREGDGLPRLLAPSLNFMRGFDSEEKSFVKMAGDMGFDSDRAIEAYRKAVGKQEEFFAAMKQEGRRILAELERDPSKIAVVLFGHSYNAFALETNKGVPSKFASRGIEIIPYDFLEYEKEENYKGTYWEMGQRVIKATRIVQRHPQLFGAYLTNFLCAIDSMMVPHFRDVMGSKPSLTIEVDEHTADAGVNTRIEAFMDVVKNYLKVNRGGENGQQPFRMATTEIDQRGRGWYVDSAGGKTLFSSGAVKTLIPSMGDLFAEGMAAALRHQNWNAEALPVCDNEAINLGRAVVTGKECLPVINIIGELLKYLKYREDPDEKVAIFLVSAGGCCRVGQYEILVKTIIEKHRLRNVAVITLENDSGYNGLGIGFRLDALKILYAADVMEDIRAAIKALAVDRERGMEIFNREFSHLLAAIDGSGARRFYPQLRKCVEVLSEIELRQPISEAKYVGVVGEIFVRRDHFSLMGIPDKLADRGFVMLDAPVTEWARYVDFLRKINMFETRTNLAGRIESLVSDVLQNHHEKKIKKLLAQTGLYEYELIEIEKYMKHSTHFFPLELTGEPGLSSGAALSRFIDKYCGVINIGPFGCMNSRMTEAVATPEMSIAGKERAARNAGEDVNLDAYREKLDVLPFLSVESDGSPFSQIMDARFETFCLQADRLAEVMRRGKKETMLN